MIILHFLCLRIVKLFSVAIFHNTIKRLFPAILNLAWGLIHQLVKNNWQKEKDFKLDALVPRSLVMSQPLERSDKGLARETLRPGSDAELFMSRT